MTSPTTVTIGNSPAIDMAEALAILQELGCQLGSEALRRQARRGTLKTVIIATDRNGRPTARRTTEEWVREFAALDRRAGRPRKADAKPEAIKRRESRKKSRLTH